LKIPSLTTEREAFKTQIAGFQNTQFKLVECTTQMQIHQAFLDRCIELVDHKLTTETASMIKYSATDTCGSVVDECLQLFGGYGYMWITPRTYADNRVARIYAGTNEIMKIVIARGLFKDLLKNERYFKTVPCYFDFEVQWEKWMRCNT
jgi:acyl-CoA dehydrogenase